MTQHDKPRLISCRQGFSVCYKEKYLYSQYEPENSIKKLISSLTILPDTLILCFSPVLCYGIENLMHLLPKNCFILALEADKNLYHFSLQYLKNYTETKAPFQSIYLEDNQFFLKILFSICKITQYKRCLPVELSAGAKFNADFYKKITQALDKTISQFWKNRITLIKMGRLYARNIFKNISFLPFTTCIKKSSIHYPILIVGAGLSFDRIIPLLKKYHSSFFILAVDSSFIPLLKHDIIPDAVIAIESQIANEQAFIGAKNYQIPLISDLTSRTHINALFFPQVSLALSEYAETNFLRKIFSSDFAPEKMHPMGSVGLTAVGIAFQLRINDSVPIFFAGLDFCYQAGKTHCKEAPQHRILLNNTNRFLSLENLNAAFRFGNFTATNKEKKIVISDPTMKNYAEMFSQLFSTRKNFFDISFCGLSLGCQNILEKDFETLAQKNPIAIKKDFFSLPTFDKNKYNAIYEFYENEEKALLRLKEIFVHGNGSLDEIRSILAEREYLYLHFPDGHILRLEQDFLNRIRGEIDFFLKDIAFGKKQLQTLEEKKSKV